MSSFLNVCSRFNTTANDYKTRSKDLYPDEVARINPVLGPIVETCAKSMGTLTNSQGHVCCGLLVGIDRLLVPAHAISNSCPENFKVKFFYKGYSSSISVYFNVLRFKEVNLNLDYCVLQLDKDLSGIYPGEIFPVYNLSQIPAHPTEDFFLIHANDEGALVVSLGKHCSGKGLGGGFCSLNETRPGSSGGINFYQNGTPFAMHICRSTGACGVSSQERKAVFLHDIYRQSQNLRCMHICQPLLAPTVYRSLCMPMITYTDVCMEPESHKTLKLTYKNKKAIDPIPARVYKKIMGFLSDMDNKKQDFYAKIWGNMRTIYKIDETGYLRLDIQSKLKEASNLQIQVGDTTISTILVSKSLSNFGGNPSKISEIVNYILRKFKGILKDAYDNEEAGVWKVSPRNPGE